MRHPLPRASALLVAAVTACEGPGLPATSSEEYGEAVAAFYRGMAAAQVGETSLAAAAFQRVTELAPGEPAGWANAGLVASLRQEPEAAAADLAEARALAPESGPVAFVSAVVERELGRRDTAVAYLRRAVESDPENAKALFLLAQLVAEADPAAGGAGATDAGDLLDRLLAAEPGNLAVLLERARIAAALRDRETLDARLDEIGGRTEGLSPALTAEVSAVRAAGAAGDFSRASTQLAFVQTELQVLPAFQDDRDAVAISPGRTDVLLEGFERLPSPSPRAADADTGLAFEAESLVVAPVPVTWVRAVWLSEESPLALVAAGRDSLWISPQPDLVDAVAYPGGPTGGPVPVEGVAPLDYDYDFRVDLALAGPGGVRLLRQQDDGGFADVTAEAIPEASRRAAYLGAWAADLDMEGDLDLVLAAADGPPVTLRNLGDGRFEAFQAFAGATGLRDFVWADLDADGDPDASLLGAQGRLQVFVNRRSRTPRFAPAALPDTLAAARAIAAADLNRDGTMDLVLLGPDGTLRRLSLEGGTWRAETLERWPDAAGTAAGSTRILVADLDNNGDLDLVVSTPDRSAGWLQTAAGWHALAPIDLPVTGVSDVTGEGRLDLLAVSPDGGTRLLANRGTTDYYSATIRPRAALATGDRRINSFGVGGEIEVRAALLYQKRLIESPAVHFGLGDHPLVDVARIIWPNGSVQAEFNLSASNETILTRQRLKGSCPWVFTYDGEGMQFVTDFIWRSALGLRINAQGDAAVIHGEDWIKIRGDQLVPRDGFYDVRITAELWETHFFDHVSLMVVDHPESTEVFVDERFTLPAPDPAVHAMQPLRAVAGAWDHTGREVTGLIAELDERYLDSFELGPYQGIAEDHFVEVALGEEAPPDGPLWLVASGWVYPTDASINVASSQGSHPPPYALRLDVPDGNGGWATVNPNLGFPAGKTKTVLIDLEGAFRPGAPRRVRLHTNMEIYWDRIAWAVARPDAPVTTTRLLPETAELRYRGFSEVRQPSRSTPETPVYGRLAATAPLWRDLVGFHTRFGDVRPLNEAVDDRYTIMNAGDELALRFPAQPPPPDGWTRDFVLIGDGWVKDGDYNTGFSTTVEPLPYHGMDGYERPPGRLEDDPGYRLHPGDWRDFHTRYVTPLGFHRALVPDGR